MINLEILISTYSTLKEYIPAKDRQAAADNLMSELIDTLNDQDVREVAATDSYLRNAYREYDPDSEDGEIDDSDY